MNNRKLWLFQPWARVVIGMILLIVLGGAASAVVMSQSHPDQPIQFPHRTHVGLGLECRFCHPGVDWGPTAGLPPTDKCWGCHQQVRRENSTELQKLVAFAENNQQIPWVPVAIQPDFVHFTHVGHIRAGLTCENCHGDLAQMTVAERQPGQNMGWCLDCHRNMRPDDWVRLSDCSLCHY
jgi:hypothetical protein